MKSVPISSTPQIYFQLEKKKKKKGKETFKLKVETISISLITQNPLTISRGEKS